MHVLHRLLQGGLFSILCVLFTAIPIQAGNLFRDFHFQLPLFNPDSAWNQKVDAVAVLPGNDTQILTLYRVLRGDISNLQPKTKIPETTWLFMDITYDDYSVAICAAGSGTQKVLVQDYCAIPSLNTDKLPVDDKEKIVVPSCSSAVRPSGPVHTGGDGHLVMFDATTHIAYDFWQATTRQAADGSSLGGGQEGDSVALAGAVDRFDVRGLGRNPDGNSSARATGVPLLAGLILPADYEKGKIAHALAVAVPGPRNAAAPDPSDPVRFDYFYPASTTETDYYSRDPEAPAAGQRLRLKSRLMDETGAVIDKNRLAPATKIFLEALRTFGAIIVDNAGAFSFYAEDMHTANLNLANEEVNLLIGKPADTPIPENKTGWQLIMETINRELEMVPFVWGPWDNHQDPSTAAITMANFEFVEQAAKPGRSRKNDLNSIKTWMYQIQGLDEEHAVDVLAETEYDLFVIEPGQNFSDWTYDTVSMINDLRYTPYGKRRLILAYIDIGQAEDYRIYWQPDWKAPTESSAGVPDFLVTIDPDGWSGNYPVAYWKEEWKKLWPPSSGIIAELAMLGFDGIYLDWVEAYDDEKVIEDAIQDKVNPEEEMIQFMEALAAAGDSVTDNFLVFPQNAPYLIDSNPQRYTSVIDGLAVEDTWFHGAGDAGWDDPDAGDLQERHDGEWTTENRLLQYQQYLDRNLPILSVGYCVSQANAEQVYKDAENMGLIPLVTRVSLSKLTETPPPALESFSGMLIPPVLAVSTDNRKVTISWTISNRPPGVCCLMRPVPKQETLEKLT